jgi:hypothetical protein
MIVKKSLNVMASILYMCNATLQNVLAPTPTDLTLQPNVNLASG